ncbi:MAG: pyridoxamine 5'-phosphate oxidase family protein [Acidimicrobiia bacterium]|nr:MAG: pyridoxamine 5'-phosphate oxidase family protein [Acidimicrobiia bacterium]
MVIATRHTRYADPVGRVLDHIDDATAEWISRQHMFFVGTAPESGGRVNLSPKGLDSFRVLSSTLVAYVDFTGSGAETIAHIRDNGRVTFMFCAFTGPPRIVRLYGTGTIHLPGSASSNDLLTLFPRRRGVRSIITADLDRVQDSCGYAVPLMDFVEDRIRLDTWIEERTDEAIAAYWEDKNRVSIDGLPALDPE